MASLGGPLSVILAAAADPVSLRVVYVPPSVSLDELQTGTEGDTLTFTARLSEVSRRVVTVDYDVVPGTATTEDYTVGEGGSSGTLTFPAESMTADFTVELIDDSRDEEDTETFMVVLRDPDNAMLGEPRSLTVTVADNDELPRVALSLSPDSSATPSEGASLTFMAGLSELSDREVRVSYRTADGTGASGAAAPEDYTVASGTLTFNAGVRERSFTVETVNDVLDEANETFTVSLTDPVNAMPGSPSSLDITIVDNDDPPIVRLRSQAGTDLAADEGGLR